MSDTSTASDSGPASWIILIGIDEYSASNPEENLEGCANDVALLYGYLKHHLVLQKKKTFIFIGRSPSLPTLLELPPGQCDRPTKKRIQRAIDHVAEKAKRGDFVLIHFSGHGDRRQTLHPEHKPQHAQDELLCLLDGFITDVEFGTRLDQMANSGLVVLATLDCCFAGGATRGEQGSELSVGLVRCRPCNQSQVSSISRGLDEEPYSHEEASSLRNAKLKESWLYRRREYTAITGCQPHEKTREIRNDLGSWNGAFTKHLIDALQALGTRRFVSTYSELQGLLDVKLKNDDRVKQQPLLLGNGNRIVFQSEILPGQEIKPSAYVLHVSNEYIEIDKGTIASVGVGDHYSLSDPRWSRKWLVSGGRPGYSGVNIEITHVYDMSARGRIKEEEPRSDASVHTEVQIGWFADLTLRAHPVVVQLLTGSSRTRADNGTQAIKNIKTSWPSFINPTMPITLIFNETPDGAPLPHSWLNIFSGFRRRARSTKPTNPTYKFNIKLDNNVFTFLDSHFEPLEHFPTLDVKLRDVTQRLMRLLSHLWRFDLVDTLQNPNVSRRPQYKFTMEELTGDDKDKEAISSWRISVYNLEHDRTLYLTIFNLTPLYGISHLTSSESHLGDPVEPNELYDTTIDIVIPKSLEEAFRTSGMTMRDTFKIFVTTEQVNLQSYIQSDIEDGLAVPPKYRHANIRNMKAGSWWVERKDIISHSLSQSLKN